MINIKTFLYNIFHKSNILYHPDLKIGNYYEIDDKILYCNFQALVDFVEIECSIAYSVYYGLESDSSRRASRGIHYLKIQYNQKEYSQVIDLYWWWKNHMNRLEDDIRSGYESDSYKEETEKLIELMKIRHLLWT